MSAHLVRASIAGTLALLATVSVSAAQTAAAQPPAQAQSHAGHAAAQQQKPPAAGQEDHSAHQKPAAQKEYPAGIPPVTDEDRKTYRSRMTIDEATGRPLAGSDMFRLLAI